MGIEIKKEDCGIWTITIKEKLAFNSYEDLMEILTTIMSIKKDHGNFKQLRKAQTETQIEENLNKLTSMSDVFKNFKVIGEKDGI